MDARLPAAIRLRVAGVWRPSLLQEARPHSVYDPTGVDYDGV